MAQQLERQQGAKEQLEPEESMEQNGQLVTKEMHGKDGILTSLVLILDHQMGMCLICTLFPLSLVLSQWVFQRKVFNEANDSHPNHPFDDPKRAKIFRNPPKVLGNKSSPISAYYKLQKSPNKVPKLLPKKSDEFRSL